MVWRTVFSELGRAAAKKELAITPILAAGGLSEKFFARNILSQNSYSNQFILFYTIYCNFRKQHLKHTTT
jgi:hypothetical protein